jgi:uncharacterized protein
VSAPVVERRPFEATAPDAPEVRGVLHWPGARSREGLVLAHGAGSDRDAPLLVAVADALAAREVSVLRCDLPFRQARAGPPSPRDGARDRDGLRHALRALRRDVDGPIALGGHSYGGRQASVLAAEEPDVAGALLLLSYPLHPPRRADRPRTGHFGALRTPAMFVHGSRDPFGSVDELRHALTMLAAPSTLLVIDGAGHALRVSAAETIAQAFADWWRRPAR